MTAILIVKDNPRVSILLRTMLNYEGYTVLEAENDTEALRILQEEHIDLILLDYNLKGEKERFDGLSGLDGISRLRAVGNNTPVIMVTGYSSDRFHLESFGIGADDYLDKSTITFRVLLAHIKARLKREQEKFRLRQSERLRFAGLMLNIDTQAVQRGERKLELTPTEYRLLALFLRNPRIILKRGIIVEHVWGWDFEGDEKVVDSYVRYVRAKLEANGEPRLIHTVRGVGYVLREPKMGGQV